MLITVFLKSQLRNKTKDMPGGLLFLGRMGRLMYSSLSETIAFLILFLFLITTHWLFFVNINDENFEIKNLNTLGIIFSLMMYDSYVKNYYSNMNFSFLKVLPYSFIKKISVFILYEFVSIKLFALIFYIFWVFIFSDSFFFDILIGICCFFFYNMISGLVTLLQLKFKFSNPTSSFFLFNLGYIGTWFIGLFFKDYFMFLFCGSIFITGITIYFFKNIYETVDYLYSPD